MIVELKVTEILKNVAVYEELVQKVEEKKYLAQDSYDSIIWDSFSVVLMKKEFGDYTGFD